VDEEISALNGPHRVQSNGNIGIPKKLREAIGVVPGHDCHWILNPDVPGTLVLIPSKQVARASEEILRAIAEKGG
jgi:bifunctional DNA-binding transcriptional regulator/antitoxin component of YhaV-PrlF toxin-antitoxin module